MLRAAALPTQLCTTFRLACPASSWPYHRIGTHQFSNDLRSNGSQCCNSQHKRSDVWSR